MGEREYDRLYTEYLNRLRRQLRGVPDAIREDAVREVQAHVDDGCRESGGDVAALQVVLQRLGPPEDYGYDLGLQLMVQAARRQWSLPMLAWAGLFWASTSLVGAVAALGSLVLYVAGLAFLADGVVRVLGLSVSIVSWNGVTYPPAWPPLVNLALGAVLVVLVTGLLRRMVSAWGRSRLAARGLAPSTAQPTAALPPGWDRHATSTMAVVALLGLGSCAVFGALGRLYPLGYSGSMSLPQDFFKNPLTVLAFLGILVFLASPALGILWVTRRSRT